MSSGEGSPGRGRRDRSGPELEAHAFGKADATNAQLNWTRGPRSSLRSARRRPGVWPHGGLDGKKKGPPKAQRMIDWGGHSSGSDPTAITADGGGPLRADDRCPWQLTSDGRRTDRAIRTRWRCRIRLSDDRLGRVERDCKLTDGEHRRELRPATSTPGRRRASRTRLRHGPLHFGAVWDGA
jgi:hypothetical protein